MQTKLRIGSDADGARLSKAFSAAVAVILFSLMLFKANDAAVYAKKALYLCTTSVIPSIFPLMIASSMLASSGGDILFSRIFGGLISRIFGVSRCSASAVIPGFLCGFPIGAIAAIRLYESRRITKNELSHLLVFVNNPGASVVIYTVGAGMLGSVKLGVLIYLSVIAASAVAGIIARFILPASASSETHYIESGISFSSLIVSSVGSAITGALNVCAYSAFFSAFAGVICGFLARYGAPFGLRAAISGFFELIGGVSVLNESSSPLFAALSSAAVCSWSGVSVLMQIASVCRAASDSEKISFAPMILSKCFQALLSPLIVLLLLGLTRFDI